LANLYVPVGDASPHGLTPLDPDPPLRVAIIRSVALIIVVARLTMVVCLHGGNPRPWKSQSSVVQHLAVRSTIGRKNVTQ